MGRINGTDGSGEIAKRIRERRGGALRPLDRVLLHSPELADGWNSLLGAIRSRNSLAAVVRELVILRIAHLNGSEYEWLAHEPEGRRAGLTDGQLAALRRTDASESAHLSETQRAVVAYTDAMTKSVVVPEAVFRDVAARFPVVKLVELTAAIAAYNMVSRLLVALEVDLP